jgi:uncharacterized protein (DUF58 family)
MIGPADLPLSPERARWLRFALRRLTPAGVYTYLVLLVAGSVAAAIGIAYPLYWFALLVFSVLVVHWLVGLVFRPRVRVERPLPARVAAGSRVEVRARVTNAGRLPAYDIAATEWTPPGIVVPDRDRVYLERLAPGETAELPYALEPARRGAYDLLGPRVVSAFPFGLQLATRDVSAPARLLVTPRFARLAAVDLPVGRKYQPGGLQLVSEVGDSGEFCGNREYRPGDRLRDVHQAAWARLGKPVVREFQQEYLCRIALVVDTQVARPTKRAEAAFEAAISLGAGVADVLSRQEYVIDIFAAGPDLYHFQAGRSLAYLDDILDVLACVEPTRKDPFETLGPAIQEELFQISTAVVLFMDWDHGRERFVRLLQDHGVAAKVIVVRDGPTTLDARGVVTGAGPITLLTPAQVEAGAERL